MVYTKENLLNILQIAPLYENMIFHEGKNYDFMATMGEDFCKSFSYEHGASKFVLIPIEKSDFVIKIPYTGYYWENEDEDDSNSENYYQIGTEEYEEYYGANEGERPWDYCATEALRYKIAKENGFEQYFAKTELLGYVNNYPIYIQERCIPLSNCRKDHRYSKKERSITSDLCGKYYNINEDWLTDFRLYYGNEKLIEFIHFIENNEWDDDLRSENIGYKNGRPILIDYSGFFE